MAPNDWREPISWTFEPLDSEAFPAVDLARSAVAASPTHPAVLNAANEQAVAAFLGGRIEWLDIVEIDAAVVGHSIEDAHVQALAGASKTSNAFNDAVDAIAAQSRASAAQSTS